MIIKPSTKKVKWKELGFISEYIGLKYNKPLYEWSVLFQNKLFVLPITRSTQLAEFSSTYNWVAKGFR